MTKEQKASLEGVPGGWALERLLNRQSAGVIGILLAIVFGAWAVLRGETIANAHLDSRAAVVVAPVAAKVDTLQTQVDKEKATVKRVRRDQAIINGKLDVIGDALLTPTQRADRRWKPMPVDEDEE